MDKLFYEEKIYALDFETTSVVSLDGENFGKFDLDLACSCRDYSNALIRRGYVYLWGFYHDGEYTEGKSIFDLLKYITDGIPIGMTRVIYCHNLPFEFQFLRNIISDFEVFARKPRKVLRAYSQKYNIEFRCSYVLTGFNLAKCGEIYGGAKMVGDLDYTLIRNRKTIHTSEEHNYLKQDCIVVANIVRWHLQAYREMKNIPMTATGKLRKELKNRLTTKDKFKIAKMIDTDIEIFKKLVSSFSGGYTHANALHTELIMDNVTSKDIVSSYPSQMLMKKFPCSKFKKVSEYRVSENYCFMLVVRFTNLRNKGANSYLSISKCKETINAQIDNGRIYKADSLVTIITDIDFQIINENYYCDYEFIEIYRARKDFLPTSFLLFIVDNFFIKQSYKGISGKEEDYRRAKENLNSLYGMCVTNVIRDDVTYDNGEWGTEELQQTDAEQRLHDNSIFYKVCSNYSWGVWVTAYARQSLWHMINKINEDVIYCDTDSVKYVGNYEVVFDTYNKQIAEEVNKVCVRLGVENKLGNIGQYEDDGNYDRFVTMGAKKYCYEKDGKLSITVSGVPKKSVKALKKIEDFSEGFLWNYDSSNKNELSYNDFQKPTIITDYQSNKDLFMEQYGICLSPTTYLLGITTEYKTLIQHLRSATSSTRASFLTDLNEFL